jgi:CheY-like chemotaxis protein
LLNNSARPCGTKRILVVEDDTDAAEVLGEFLREYGHETTVVGDSVSALQTLEQLQPDVALVDIGLPVVDGYQLAERMRQTIPGMRCRLIALTGYGQDEDHLRSRQAGFARHLVKPVDLDALLKIVEGP